MRKLILLIAIIAWTAPLLAQESQWHFKSELLLRYDRQNFDDSSRESVNRYRVRWRPGIVVNPNFSWEFGVEAELNGIEESDDNVDPPRFPEFHNPALDRDNFKRNEVVLSRAYVKFDPTTDLQVIGGKFVNPFLNTEMLWDNDLRPNGGAVKASFASGDEAFRITGRFGDFYASHYLHDRTNVVALQGIAEANSGVTTLTFAFSYYDHDVDELDPALLRTNTRSGLEPANDFNVVDVIGRIRFNFEFVPVMAQIDWVKNTAAEVFNDSLPGAGDSGYMFEANLGKIQEPGDFHFGYAYHHLESDAVLAAYNTDDWWFPTRGEGFRIHFKLMLASWMTAGVSYLNQSFIDQDPEFKRWQLSAEIHWP